MMNIPLHEHKFTNENISFNPTGENKVDFGKQFQTTHIFVSVQHEQYISYSIIILYGLLDQHVQLWDD